MSTQVQLVLSILVFVSLLTTLTALSWGLAARREARKRKMAHRIGLDVSAQSLTTLDVAPRHWPLRWFHTQLARAGRREALPHVFVRIGASALGGLVLSFALLDGPASLVGVLAGAIPILLLVRRAHLRSKRITEQLPDALDRIGRALRAGHAFNDALRAAAQDLPEPIGEELARVSEANRLGVDMRTCLETLAQQNPGSFDLRLMVSAVLLNRDTGGNLVEILDHLADTIRERLLFEQKVQSLTAETNVSSMILGVLPFIVAGMLVLLRPAYLQPLFVTGPGQALLAVALGSLAVGVLLLRALARVDV